MTDLFCLAVLTGREFSAVSELTDAGCREVACPTRRVITGRDKETRKPIWRDAPLWPGYIFATVPENAWHGVYSAKSVIGPLCSQGEPRALTCASRAAYEATCRACDAGEFDDEAAEQRINIGDRLRVIIGPYSGLEVSVTRKLAHDLECYAEIEMMGHRPRVVVAYDAVAAI